MEKLNIKFVVIADASDNIDRIKSCIDSINQAYWIMLATNKTKYKEYFEKFEPTNISHFDTGDLSDFNSRAGEVNKGLSNDSDWVVIVDANDALTDNYLETLERHIATYNDCSIFLPIAVKTVGGKYSGLMNTCFWTQLFHEDSHEGKLGNNSIESASRIPQQLIYNFNYGGIAINTKVLKNVEANANRAFGYGLEYVLNAVHKGYEVRVMGKVCYIKNIAIEQQGLGSSVQQKELVSFSKRILGEE